MTLQSIIVKLNIRLLEKYNKNIKKYSKNKIIRNPLTKNFTQHTGTKRTIFLYKILINLQKNNVKLMISN